MTVCSKIYLCLPGLCFVVPGPQHACLCQRPDPRTLPFQRREVCCPPDAGCRAGLVHSWGEAHFNTSMNCSMCLPSGSDLRGRCSSDRHSFAVISLLIFCKLLELSVATYLRTFTGLVWVEFNDIVLEMTAYMKTFTVLLFMWSVFDFIKCFECVVAQLL